MANPLEKFFDPRSAAIIGASVTPPLDFVVELKEKFPDKPIHNTFAGDTRHDRVAKAFLEPRGVPTYPMMEEPLEVLDVLARCRLALERG